MQNHTHNSTSGVSCTPLCLQTSSVFLVIFAYHFARHLTYFELRKLQNKIDACGAWSIDEKLDEAMEALRCPPRDAKVANLSGGELRRIALCRLLLSSPDILLLDEPTNHLDAQSVAWLERFLADFKVHRNVMTKQ